MSEKLSLLDTGDRVVVQWCIVYRPLQRLRWWNRHLKDGFEHVELWRSVRFGPLLTDVLWLRLDPGLELTRVDVLANPEPPWITDPTLTVQRVVASAPLWVMRHYFHMGPISCVEIVKACLGIRAWTVLTPYGLFKYIARRGGTLTR
jgi:hypothetical protein